MIRQIPASFFTSVFLVVVYLISGYRTLNGLSLLIAMSLLWFGWALWAHLDHEVRTARTDYEAAHAALARTDVEETNR